MKKAAKKNVVKKTPVRPSLKDDVVKLVERAAKTGKWMVAVFRVEDKQLHLDRTAVNFPKGDIDLAMRLIVENVQQLK